MTSTRRARHHNLARAWYGIDQTRTNSSQEEWARRDRERNSRCDGQSKRHSVACKARRGPDHALCTTCRILFGMCFAVSFKKSTTLIWRQLYPCAAPKKAICKLSRNMIHAAIVALQIVIKMFRVCECCTAEQAVCG